MCKATIPIVPPPPPPPPHTHTHPPSQPPPMPCMYSMTQRLYTQFCSHVIWCGYVPNRCMLFIVSYLLIFFSVASLTMAHGLECLWSNPREYGQICLQPTIAKCKHIFVKVILDISGSPIEHQWSTRKYPGWFNNFANIVHNFWEVLFSKLLLVHAYAISVKPVEFEMT